MSMMAKVYADLIRKGKKTVKDVPKSLQKEVKALLAGGGRFPVRVRDARKVEQAVRDYHFARMRSKQRNK